MTVVAARAQGRVHLRHDTTVGENKGEGAVTGGTEVATLVIAPLGIVDSVR
jgi:hypothetical protein